MDIFLFIIAMVVALMAGIYMYIFLIKDTHEYRKAKADIFPFVESYKKKCNGNNRFVVTVESLQDSFREYETKIIKKVWLDLVNEKLIELDPNDGVWCIRKYSE